MNFSRYLGILRINYITQLMYENEKYLNYTIQSLSDERNSVQTKFLRFISGN